MRHSRNPDAAALLRVSFLACYWQKAPNAEGRGQSPEIKRLKHIGHHTDVFHSLHERLHLSSAGA